MRILHLIQRFPPAIGGGESWCEGVARYQAARGHRVDVLTLRLLDEDEVWTERPGPPGPIAVGGVDLEPGLRIRRCHPSPTPFAIRRFAQRLGVNIPGRVSAELFGLALAAAREADVVHLHHGPIVQNFVGLAIARRVRRPAIITPHFHPGDPNHEQPIARRLLRWCDVVIVVTPQEGDELARRGVAAERIVTASNAIDLPPTDSTRDAGARLRGSLGVDPDAALVTYIGRKTPEKDLPTLVRAAHVLAQTRKLALVLAGPSTDGYRAQSLAWGAGDARIIELPPLTEHAKHALLAGSDVLAQPSPHEAFGIVFLEAWAHGVPVVGAAAGSVPAVVADAGLTFAPGDAADLAAKLARLLEHRDEAQAMGARGRARVMRDYTWERVGAAVDQAYALARAGRS
jgi:glycosyltransferase involved in cell wall biosynthesis